MFSVVSKLESFDFDIPVYWIMIFFLRDYIDFVISFLIILYVQKPAPEVADINDNDVSGYYYQQQKIFKS